MPVEAPDFIPDTVAKTSAPDFIPDAPTARPVAKAAPDFIPDASPTFGEADAMRVAVVDPARLQPPTVHAPPSGSPSFNESDALRVPVVDVTKAPSPAPGGFPTSDTYELGGEPYGVTDAMTRYAATLPSTATKPTPPAPYSNASQDFWVDPANPHRGISTDKATGRKTEYTRGGGQLYEGYPWLNHFQEPLDNPIPPSVVVPPIDPMRQTYTNPAPNPSGDMIIPPTRTQMQIASIQNIPERVKGTAVGMVGKAIDALAPFANMPAPSFNPNDAGMPTQITNPGYDPRDTSVSAEVARVGDTVQRAGEVHQQLHPVYNKTLEKGTDIVTGTAPYVAAGFTGPFAPAAMALVGGTEAAGSTSYQVRRQQEAQGKDPYAPEQMNKSNAAAVASGAVGAAATLLMPGPKGLRLSPAMADRFAASGLGFGAQAGVQDVAQRLIIAEATGQKVDWDGLPESVLDAVAQGVMFHGATHELPRAVKDAVVRRVQFDKAIEDTKAKIQQPAPEPAGVPPVPMEYKTGDDGGPVPVSYKAPAPERLDEAGKPVEQPKPPVAPVAAKDTGAVAAAEVKPSSPIDGQIEGESLESQMPQSRQEPRPAPPKPIAAPQNPEIAPVPPPGGVDGEKSDTSITPEPAPATIPPQGDTDARTQAPGSADNPAKLVGSGEAAGTPTVVRQGGGLSGEDAAKRFSASVEGIRKAVAGFRGHVLDVVGDQVFVKTPDGARIRWNLVESIAKPVGEQLNRWVESLREAARGPAVNINGRRIIVPRHEGDWAKLSPEDQAAMHNEFRTEGFYEPSTDSITTTHAVGSDHSIGAEEIAHRALLKLKRANPEMYKKLATRRGPDGKQLYPDDEAIVAALLDKKVGGQVFDAIRKGTFHEEPNSALKYRSPRQKAEDLLLDAGKAEGVLMSDEEFEAFTSSDTAGIHPDVLVDYRRKDANGFPIRMGKNSEGKKIVLRNDQYGKPIETAEVKLIRTPSGREDYRSYAYDAEGRKLEHFVNPDTEYSDKQQQRIIDEVLLTKEQRIEKAAQHYYDDPGAHPDARKAAALVLKRPLEDVAEPVAASREEALPDKPDDDVPFAVRKKGEEEKPINTDLLGNRVGADVVGGGISGKSGKLFGDAASKSKLEGAPITREGKEAKIAEKFNADDADNGTGRLFAVRKKADPEGEYHPVWYSKAGRVIGEKIGGKAAPEQVRQTLLNSGVKPDEMKWSGLDDYLRNRNGVVTKQELLDHLKQNNVQVQEVMKGGEFPKLDWEHKQGKGGDFWVSDRHVITKNGEDYNVIGNIGNTGPFKTLEDAKHAAQKDANTSYEPDTKFGKYQLPGGENYRELLLTLPADAERQRFRVLDRKNHQIHGTFDTREEAEAFAKGGGLSRAAKGLEVVEKQVPANTTFHSTHWDEPNVLAHVRMSDRTGPNGEKILHVEEIQSDWHQKGRDEGYRPDKEQKLEELVTRRLELERLGKDATPEQKTEWAGIMNEIKDLSRGGVGVPDAPFRKTWHEMALRRILRLAAENGYDKVSWTPGEEQNQRYDLAKQVENVNYLKNADGTYDLSAKPITGGLHDIGSRISENKLADYVGKDLAEKIIAGGGDASSKDNPRGWHTFRGLDLAVGGSGMKGFYDKIVPEYLNKYGKKWGAKVGETKIPGPELTGYDPIGERMGKKPPNGPSISVPSIDITPEMKKSVLEEGQPLFAVRRRDAQGNIIPRGQEPAEDAVSPEKAQEPELKKSPALFGDDDTPRETTGIKNAVSESDRAKLGLDKLTQPDVRHFDDMMKSGVEESQKNPTAINTLLEKMRRDPEYQLDTVTESGLAMKHKVDLENELQRLHANLKEARANGDPLAEQDALTSLEIHRAAIKDFTDLTKRTGTATARALAFRRSMAAMDYSLSHMEAEAEAAKGSPLTPAELEKAGRTYEAIKAKNDLLEKAMQAEQQKRADAEADRDHQKLLREAAEKKLAARPVVVKQSQQTTAQKVDPKSYGAKNKLFTRDAYEKAKAELLASNITYSGLPVDKLAALAKMGAFHLEAGARELADFSAKMIADLGEKIRPHLDDIHAAALKLESEERQKSLVAKIKERKADGATPRQLQPYLREMALDLIKSGVKDREAVLDSLHKTVVDNIDPSATREQVRDTLSGYGDYKPLTKGEAVEKLRDLNQQYQKLAQLEALQRKEAPQKTGVERQSPSDATRTLQKQVNEAKKAAGIVTVDPAAQLKTTLDAMKTRAKNTIADLQTEIDTKQRIVKGKSVPISDAELDGMKKQIADLRKQHDEIFGKNELTEEQRLNMATAAAKRNLENWESRLAEAKKGRFSIIDERPNTISGPELDAIRAKASTAKEEFQELQNLDPAYQGRKTESTNQALRTRLTQQIADLKDRMAREDFTPRPAPPKTPILPETAKLKADAERVKAEWNNQVYRWQQKNRPLWVKGADLLAKWPRLAVLSGTNILIKLPAATAWNLMAKPAYEAVGSVLSRVPGISQVASKAPSEHGGFSPQAYAKAIAIAFTTGVKGGYQKLFTRAHQSDLDLAYGHGGPPPDAMELFGWFHGALKEPAKTFAFRYSMEKRLEGAIRSGADASDPLIQMQAGLGAYMDAKRSIFQEKNILTSMFHRNIAQLESARNAAGEHTIAGQAGAAALRGTLPVVGVPTNIVKQTFEHALGLPIGAVETAKAWANGIDKLKPEQADQIMRHLKRGSVGAAVALLAIFHPDMFGGFYQKGEKRKEGEVDDGEMWIGDTKVSRVVLHHPLIEVAQLFATAIRVANSRLHADNPTKRGIVSGAVAAGLGLLDELPFARQAEDLAKMMDSNQREKAVGNTARSLMIPQLIQQIARWTDEKNQHGDAVKRDPKTIVQNLETGIPGLRQNVSKKQ